MKFHFFLKYFKKILNIKLNISNKIQTNIMQVFAATIVMRMKQKKSFYSLRTSVSVWETALGCNTPPQMLFVIRVLPILLTFMGLLLYFWTNTLLKTTCWDQPPFHFHTWMKSSSTAQHSCKASFSETRLGSHVCIVSKLYGIIKIATVNLERWKVIMRAIAYWGGTHLLAWNLQSNPDWPQFTRVWALYLLPKRASAEPPCSSGSLPLCADSEERDCHLLS